MSLLKLKLPSGVVKLVKYEYVPKMYLKTNCSTYEDGCDVPEIGLPSRPFENHSFLNPGYRFFGGVPQTRILYDIPVGNRITATFNFKTVQYSARTIFGGVEIVGCDGGIMPYGIKNKTAIRFQSTTVTYDTTIPHYNGYSPNEHFFVLGNNGTTYTVTITPSDNDIRVDFEDKYLILHNFSQVPDVRIANFYEFETDSTQFDLYYLEVFG